MDHLDYVTVLFGGSLVVAVLCLVVYHASLRREEHELLRETSRFPMFAARGALVELVATGRMAEKEAAWNNAYRAVNSLLGMHQQLHALDILSRYAKHVSRMETDPAYRQMFVRMLNVEKAASARIPEFGAACAAIQSACMHIVQRRTRARHRVVLLAFMGFLIVVRAVFTAGIHVGRAVADAMRRPNDGAKYFGVQHC